MRSRVPKATPEILKQIGLSYLDRYAASVAHFRLVMQRKVRRYDRLRGETTEAADIWIEDLIRQLLREKRLDDPAYAAARARSLYRNGRPIKFIRQALRAKSLDRASIDAAIEALENDRGYDEAVAAITFAKRRRFGPFRIVADAPERRVKELAAFARGGFSYAVSRRVVTAESVAILTEWQCELQ